MDWTDRLDEEIILTSPSGSEFTASWRGDQRSKEKRLGIFEFPKIRGALIQRMGAGPARYPLTFYFDGPDHDIIASAFWDACDEDDGTWTIQHPTLGLMRLDLVSVSEDIQPTESGNITVVSTEWIEPMDGGLLPTVPQLEAEIQNQIEVVQSQSAVQFVKNSETTEPVSFRNSVMSTLTTIRRNINTVRQTITEIRSDIETIYRAAVNTVQSEVMSSMSLAGELQMLMSLPGDMTQDTATRFEFYTGLLNNTRDFTPKQPNVKGLTLLACQEIVGISCLVGTVQSVNVASITSREDALSYLDALKALFIEMTAILDEGQQLYVNSPINRQFFSQSLSYNDLALLVAQTMQLLLVRSYNLSVAKRFVLTRNRAPIEIAITEGVDFDVFILSNHLKGDDILLLPAGRQVVVYA